MKKETPESIDEYIAGFPKTVQVRLRRIRSTIRKAAPKAQESISYGIPAFKLDGRALVYFAAFREHLSVYPAPRSAKEFAKELAAYGGGKGTVKFPLDEPVPLGLITRIVKFRMRESQR